MCSPNIFPSTSSLPQVQTFSTYLHSHTILKPPTMSRAYTVKPTYNITALNQNSFPLQTGSVSYRNLNFGRPVCYISFTTSASFTTDFIKHNEIFLYETFYTFLALMLIKHSTQFSLLLFRFPFSLPSISLPITRIYPLVSYF